jgi:PRC-barrel domain
MIKTLLATTALASMLALGAQAQNAPAAGADQTAPAAADQTPVIPKTADEATAPEPAGSMAQAPATAPMGAAPPLKEGWTTVDVSTVSADTLIGADIQNYDQDTVASIKDVLLTPEGKVKNVVAQFGGFLGFGDSTVLLSMDEINVAKDADGNLVVLTSLTPDDLKGRPEYTPDNG